MDATSPAPLHDADGRHFPWGDQGEPTFARVVDTSAGEPSREDVYGHPFDEGPHGARGLAGNTRDWCLDVWKHEGPCVEGDRLRVEAAALDNPDFRVIRGGGWSSVIANSRVCARFGGRPGIRRPVVGFRVARACHDCVKPSV